MQSRYGEARAAARPRLAIQLREPRAQNLLHEHRAVAVRLEVDADVEGLGRVVHVFHPRLREGDLDAPLPQERRRRAVGVGRLHDAQRRFPDEWLRGREFTCDEHGEERGDLVAVDDLEI